MCNFVQTAYSMGKGAKSITFYLLMIIVFGSFMYLIIKQGESHQPDAATTSLYSAPGNMWEGFMVFWQLLVSNITSDRKSTRLNSSH